MLFQASTNEPVARVNPAHGQQDRRRINNLCWKHIEGSAAIAIAIATCRELNSVSEGMDMASLNGSGQEHVTRQNCVPSNKITVDRMPRLQYPLKVVQARAICRTAKTACLSKFGSAGNAGNAGPSDSLEETGGSTTVMRNQVCRMAQLCAQTRIVPLLSRLRDDSASLGRNRHFASANGETTARFEGQVAVVTGGASGIGEATVRRFVREGARVVIADVQEALGKKLAADLGPAAQFVYTDVCKEEHVAAAVDTAFAWEGRLDVMVNNAGIVGALGAIDELDIAEYDYTLAVDLRGMVLGVKHAARVMKPAQKGIIVCTGSTASVTAGLGPHCYTIAKRGIAALVMSAAFELKSHGVRINMVSPDVVPTPLVANAFATFPTFPDDLSVSAVKDIIDANASVKGQSLTADGVARAIAFLASDDSEYMTGHNLVLDGGRTTGQLTIGLDDWFRGRIPFLREAGIRSVAS